MHARNKIAPAMLAVIGAMASAAARAETISFNDALASAYSSNPKLVAQRAALRATDEDVSKALAGWKPTIAVTGNYGWTQNSVGFLPIPDGTPQGVTVTLSQPVFNGTTVPLTREAKAKVRAGIAQLSSVEQSVLAEAAKAYFDVVANEAILRFRQDNATLLANQLDMAQQRFAAHDTTVTDVQLVQSRLAGAKAEVAAATSVLMSARAEFLRVIGRPAEELELAPALPAIPSDHDQAMSRALANNPDLTEAKELARAADADVAAADDNFLPQVSLQAQYETSKDMIGVGVSNNATSVMATVKVPLYQAGADYAAVRQASQTRAKANADVNDMEGQVRANFEANWQAEIATQQAIDFHSQQVQSAQAAYDGFSAGIRAGENSTYDLLNSAQEVLTARIALAQAQEQRQLSQVQVAVSLGAMTAQSLHLPGPIYDPNIYYDRNVGSWIGFGD